MNYSWNNNFKQENVILNNTHNDGIEQVIN